MPINSSVFLFFFNCDSLHVSLKKVLQDVELQKEDIGQKHLGNLTRKNPKIIGCLLRLYLNPWRLWGNEKHSSSKESQCLAVWGNKLLTWSSL